MLVMTIGSNLNAQNSVKSSFLIDGAIHNDTTWASDTVMVNGDIYVPDTVTLTINPGTVVLFTDWYEIDVQGQLLAIGTINDSIIFKAADTSGFSTYSHVGWPGIKFDTPSSTDTSVISFCVFEFVNSTSDYDAAVYVNDFSKLIVEKSRFSYNYNSSEASCIQVENESNMIISGNVFTNNYSYYSCIQFGCSSSGDFVNPLIENNIFRFNYGLDEGSCLKLSGYNTAMVVNNIFEYNYCEGYGGAIVISGYSNPILIGNLIANNYAEYNGGGVAVKYYTNPKFINNTIVYNHTEDDGGGVSVGCSTENILFQNNIIWGNSADTTEVQLYCYDGGTDNYKFLNNIIQYGFDSIYFENTFTGQFNNNLSTNPMFVDTINGDFHLLCTSPAIDAAMNPSIVMPLTDIDGSIRKNGVNFDLGAYELNANANLISQPQSVSVMTGTVATFTITATNATSFQWEVSPDLGSNWTTLTNDAVYSGVTTNTLTVNADYSMNGNMYHCIVEGSCPGNLTPSNPAFLIVNYNVGLNEKGSFVAVYPNPAKDHFFIENATGANVFISDMNGRVVLSSVINSDKESISVSDLNSGIYFIKIVTLTSTQIERLVIE
jgi:hypothetical protein